MSLDQIFRRSNKGNIDEIFSSKDTLENKIVLVRYLLKSLEFERHDGNISYQEISTLSEKLRTKKSDLLFQSVYDFKL